MMLNDTCIRALDSMQKGVFYAQFDLGLGDDDMAAIVDGGYVRPMITSKVYTRTAKTIQLTLGVL